MVGRVVSRWSGGLQPAGGFGRRKLALGRYDGIVDRFEIRSPDSTLFFEWSELMSSRFEVSLPGSMLLFTRFAL